MLDRARITHQRRFSAEFMLLSEIVKSYRDHGDYVSSQSIRNALAACACRFRNVSSHSEALPYLIKSLRETRSASLQQNYREAANATYLLTHYRPINPERTEETVLQLLNHLGGFTLHLQRISQPFDQIMTSVGELSLLKCVWYKVYAVVLHFLNVADARGWEKPVSPGVRSCLNILSQLAEIWWTIDVAKTAMPVRLFGYYCASELKLSVYELQQAFDCWHSMTEERPMMLATLRQKLNRVHDLLQQASCRSRSTALEFRYAKPLQDAEIAYKSFLLEYYIFVKPLTEPECFRGLTDLAIEAARDCHNIFRQEAVGSVEEREKRAMCLLFLACLILRRIGDNYGALESRVQR
jgi:hypothetical protein